MKATKPPVRNAMTRKSIRSTVRLPATHSIANVARQAATRSEGRPRREIREVPSDAPDALSDGDSPACLTMEEEVS
jgi:hypothetical protein